MRPHRGASGRLAMPSGTRSLEGSEHQNRSGAGSMRPIRTLAEIPFARHDPIDLLNLRQDRDLPQEDYTGFGHCRADLCLEDEQGVRTMVRDALVLALHSCDLGEPMPDDIELEFFVDEVAPGYSVRAHLSAFLAARLPAL